MPRIASREVHMSPGPEDEVGQAERRRILREGTTFHRHAQSHANDEAGGRFAAVNPTTVTGATPIPSYPALPSGPWSGSDPVPTEPPLGYSVDDMPGLENPTGVSVSPPVATGAPVAGSAPSSELVPPLADDVEPGAGAPSFSSEQTNE
jgi:hypothetical protein